MTFEKKDSEKFAPIKKRENIFKLLKPVNKESEFVITTAFRKISPTEKRFLQKYKNKTDNNNNP